MKKKRIAPGNFCTADSGEIFLTKYEESNNALHKKMLWVSEKVHRAIRGRLVALVTATQSLVGRSQKMLDALWAGQCNCSYWHRRVRRTVPARICVTGVV